MNTRLRKRLESFDETTSPDQFQIHDSSRNTFCLKQIALTSREIREEEKEWTEYTSCLEQVNEQLVEQVFAHIVEMNVAAVIEVL